jgi:Na+-transporting NADH:ubiquinone oxidoreductase subunit NqrB
MPPLFQRPDARYFQMTCQLLLLAYGLFFLHWNSEWTILLLYPVAGLLLQFLAGGLYSGDFSWHFFLRQGAWKSALVSCFSLCLLLKTHQWYIALLAVTITVFGKYLFRMNGQHVFNPSALGIVAAVALTGEAWISPGQWGSGLLLLLAISLLGFIVLTRVQQADSTLSFLCTYAFLLLLRQVWWLGWPADHLVQSLSSGSLLLFSFFMISDPRTVPHDPVMRIAFAMLVAVTAFYLTAFHWINGAPVWVLVILQPLVPLLNRWKTGRKFEWADVHRAG